jgi:hypothetical protein
VARSEVEAHGTVLKELEEALNELDKGIVKRYHKLYEERGGEQFRPDLSKFSCEFQFIGETKTLTAQIQLGPKPCIVLGRKRKNTVRLILEYLLHR